MQNRYILFALTIIISITAAAQDNVAMMQKSDSILSNFDRRFELLDSLIFSPVKAGRYAGRNIFEEASQKYGDTQIADSLYDEALRKSVEAQAKYIKSPTGLQITGQSYYRLDNNLGLNDMDDDDAVSRYNAKIQAEIRWNFFNSGLFKPNGKIREAEIQADIDRIAYQKETRGTEYARQREYYRTRQDSALCAVLTHRVKNLNMLSDAYMFLLSYENISSDDIMLTLSERAEAERKLGGLTVGDVYSSDLATPDAFIVRLDTAEFLQYVNLNQADFKIARKRLELFEQRAKNVSYWDQVDASPFLRYSYYTRPTLANSSNVDAGIYFKFPLTNEASKQRSALKAQGAAYEAEQYLRMRQIADEVAYVATEVERLNNSIIGEYRRSLQLRQYISMRKDAYENRKGEYNRLARMKEYNAYLLSLERLLEFQYSRDQQIAGLAKFLCGENVSDFCTIELLSTLANTDSK
ncbi:MAG: hypothetical protein K2K93_09900 [Muribaculaceae bacterium]|nr:hypothetical protein [Muribaculaceae bacterium]